MHGPASRPTTSQSTDQDAMIPVPGAPPVFTGLTRELDTLVQQPLLDHDVEIPKATFAFAKKDASGRKLPQAIAHRGYKAKFPENTMAAFRGAVEAGADALETDVHLTKDGVVVLSHDKDLKRCFGNPAQIADSTSESLSTLRTLSSPHEPMPTLTTLLTYLSQPQNSKIWLLLDIKLSNPPDAILSALASNISSVPPCSPSTPWSSRIVLGVWAASFLPHCTTHLPGFAIAHIGFSVLYAAHFLKVPNLGFNMLCQILQAPPGWFFMRHVQAKGRPVFAWTVGRDASMRWCVRKGVDGVITDDPARFLEVRREVADAAAAAAAAKNSGKRRGSWSGLEVRMWLDVLRANVFAFLFGWMFWWWFGGAKAGGTKELVRYKRKPGDLKK